MSEGVASIYKSNTTQGIGDSSQEVSFYARVTYTLLGDDVAKSKEMDVPVGTLGAVQCQLIYNGAVNGSTPPIVALPHNSFIKRFPIKNEVVEVVAAVTPKSNNPKDNNLRKYYYKDVLNIWDAVEHNSVPDQLDGSKDSTGDFKETGNVSKLSHQTGDFTLEGRFGNTIRFGSSKMEGTAPWKGGDNKPVTVITNGQGQGNSNTFEDIDNNGTSFYMLSGQSLSFTPANLNFDSYHQKVSPEAKNKIITPGLDKKVADPAAPLQKEVAEIPSKEEPQPKYETQASTSDTEAAEEEISFLPDNEQEYTQIFDDEVPVQPRSIVVDGLIQCNTVSKPEKHFSGISKNLSKLTSYVTQMINAYPQLKKDTNAINKIKALLTIMANETGLEFAPTVESLNYSYKQAIGAFTSSCAKISEKEFSSRFGSPKVTRLQDFGNFVYNNPKLGLGNKPNSNDGYNFRGRGLFQITGRESYAAISQKLFEATDPKYKGLVKTKTFFLDKPDEINNTAYMFKIFMFAFFEGHVCSKGYSVIKGDGVGLGFRYDNVHDVLMLINSGIANSHGNSVYKSYLEKFTIIYGSKDLHEKIESLLK